MNRKMPSQIISFYGSSRDFKREKRQQVRAVLQALDDLQRGCAFFPTGGYHEVADAQGAMKSLKDRLSVKKWGR